MSVDPKFFAASEAAEGWTVLLADFAYWAERGNWKCAYAKLFQLRWEIEKHRPALESALDKLAAVGIVIRHQHGVHRRRVYNSAHEATLEIAGEAVDVLIYESGLGNEKLPDDWQGIAEQQLARLWERFVVSEAELSAGIRRERAKLMQDSQAKPEGKNRSAKEPPDCESLSTKEFIVLRVLQKESPCRVLLPDLAAKAEIAQKTCGKIINSLIERGLADRPTERKGAGITPAGQALLVTASPLKAP